jgi:hypothetical protein
VLRSYLCTVTTTAAAQHLQHNIENSTVSLPDALLRQHLREAANEDMSVAAPAAETMSPGVAHASSSDAAAAKALAIEATAGACAIETVAIVQPLGTSASQTAPAAPPAAAEDDIVAGAVPGVVS